MKRNPPQAESRASNEVDFFLWESAAAGRDDRGWKPLPQERYFITDRMSSRSTQQRRFTFSRLSRIS